MKNKKFNFFLLNIGCKVNLYEINAIGNDLKQINGHETSDINQAEVVIVNTCSVTNKADRKSKYMINKVLKAKLKPLVIVMGCFSQINKQWFENKDIPIVIGNQYKNKIKDYLLQYFSTQTNVLKVDPINTTKEFECLNVNYFENNTRAFLKIQDGCDYMCSYCIIPFTRGRQRSKNHNLILKNIDGFVTKGYKEIILTGVNTAGYLDGKYTFYDLLKEINNIKGNFRVRISSVEPFQINHEIIDLIASNPKRWTPHLHVCVQSCCDKTLKDMNRKYSIKQFISLLIYIRKKIPNCAITTDFIVGFVSETEKDFQESVDNLNLIKFSDMHVFPFSLRQNTKANLLVNKVTPQQLKNRIKIITEIKDKYKNQYLSSFINKKVDVLFENKTGEYISGHAGQFFEVYVKSEKNQKNEILPIYINEVTKDNKVFGIIKH